MWRFTLIFFCCAGTKVTAKITVKCSEYDDFPSSSSHAPSTVADLKVKLVTDEKQNILIISWAINIDASTKTLEGTRIEISGEPTWLCTYNPPFAVANLAGLKQEWFNYSVVASHGYYDIKATNIPWPLVGSGPKAKYCEINVPPRKPKSTTSTTVTTVQITTKPTSPVVIADVIITAFNVLIIGVLATLTLIATSSYLIYKICGARVASCWRCKELHLPPKEPVPVLVVYPAKNSVFQQAVVALAEFLQQHGHCRVAIDMWQQEKIAELGPMRWLAREAEAAQCVLIVSPLAGTPSSLPCPSSPNQSLPEASIPATAHDLYLLTLNMVASQAKSTNRLAKFCVVQLSEQKSKKACALPPELMTCRTFCLMEDLSKLCKTVHAQRQGGNNLFFRSFGFYNKKSAFKLKEAVERQKGQNSSISREKLPLTSPTV